MSLHLATGRVLIPLAFADGVSKTPVLLLRNVERSCTNDAWHASSKADKPPLKAGGHHHEVPRSVPNSGMALCGKAAFVGPEVPQALVPCSVTVPLHVIRKDGYPDAVERPVACVWGV